MYLQSLEIIGFKSFAPKTVLTFHRGVTAIVGPNGCGKSNVLDAIRWVLGEQSAKALRGGEMADVIFSGTDSRPALGMAEVSMTFAECEKELGVEWNEVRITRRVFRDGRSEYFLNKTPCRLRDIHQLFMDTGVGRSAYSIMEQGRIDQILSSRPEDRRAIFEEAAGITKYKAQKKEALRKLEYTEANLLRVQDIIKEVKRQIGSLQRQAGKARRYQALMNDLRTLDTHLSHKNYTAMRDELAGLRAELARGDEARDIHQTEIAQQESELTAYRTRIEELDREMAGARDGIQQQRNRIFSAESRIQTNRERSEEAAALVTRHNADIAQAEEKLRTQQTQIDETDSLLGRMLETLRSLESSLNEQNSRVQDLRGQRSQIERELQQAGEEISRHDAKLSSLRGEISTAAGRRESGETRLHLLKTESASAAQAVDQLSGSLEALRRRSESAVLATEQAQAEVADASTSLEAAEAERQNAEAVLNVAGKEAAALESRIEVLRQLQESGEGFRTGTQSLLHGLDNPSFFQPAIHGALAQQIDVEPRLIPAIEAALGVALEAVVFKDTGVAEAALATLSGKKLGRAAVIPADWIAQAQASDKQLPFGVLGWAADCVRGEGRGPELAKALLQDVVVVENLETAFRLRQEHHGLAFATLTGEFIASNGLVHGGQSGENQVQSALQRKAQIHELDAQLVAATARIEALAAARSNAQAAVETAADRLKTARAALQSAQVEAAASENERRLAERQLAEAEARKASLGREMESIETSLQASLAQLGELEALISQTSSALETARGQREEAERKLVSARELEQSAGEALNDIRIRFATERQQQENLNRQRGPMAARLVELSELIDARKTDILNDERRIDTLRSDSEELTSSIESWRADLASGEASLASLGEARREIHENAEAIESSLRVSREQLGRLQDERSRTEVRIAQTEMRLENLRNHVSHRYQADLESFEPDSYALLCTLRDRSKNRTEPQEESGEAETPAVTAADDAQPVGEPAIDTGTIPWSRIEELVAELTERVETMGPVNVDAIQEFDELEQRYVFLEKQNADLVNSKAELLEVISKINRTTKELFAETFEKIRVNFQEMFAELFGGGRANLMLVDDSDPLESGIEIIAKPPGKQLQSISLLSGGERTMTAVSLLFAIYMVKPSPFCVLDEMDAPLDESNISRFVKILDRFVGQSQFVVITHNKRTISRADMLYGVTMEEHGVSKLVSVKFTDAESGGRSKSIAESFGKSGDLASDTGAEEASAKESIV